MYSFSPFVIGALVDVITGGAGNDTSPPVGIYRSGPMLEQFFLDCGVDMRIGVLSRVPATRDCLRRIAQHDPPALVRVIERVADPRGYVSMPEKGQAVVAHLNGALEGDGLAVSIAGGKAELVQRTAAGAAVLAVAAKIAVLDFDTVQRDISRAQKSIDDDPEDAVTAACSLIESVCRSILVELHLALPAKKDVDGLMRATQDALNLSPGRSDLPPEIEQDVRQILGGLTSVAKGVGALRTHGGDAHGRERGFKRIDARIARLSLNAASSAALFLIETWERQQHRALPLREDTASSA